jgi:hypothetical protein
LSEISESIRTYNAQAEKQAEIARKMYQLNGVLKLMEEKK